MKKPWGEPWLRYLLAAMVAFAGVMHFVQPLGFVKIMPAALPRAWDYPLVYFTGICEIAGGIGLLVPMTRRAAGFSLVVFFVCVFPANIQAALEPARMGISPAAAWGRLPFQFLLIAWAYRYAKRDADSGH